MTYSYSRMNVTVGFNGSAESIWAVLWAADEAARRFLRLHIVQRREDSDIAYWVGPNIDALVEGDCSPIEAVRELAMQHHPDLTVNTFVVDDIPQEVALTDQLERAVMVVVGASSHPGIRGFWLGNTPRWLSRHATCPVVVVGRPVQPQRPRRVVVACTDPSSRAIFWACHEAALHGVPVTVLHVSNTAGDDDSGQRVLDAALQQARHSPIGVSGELRHGDPADEILQACNIGDLLVLGSGHRGPLGSAFLGSTIDTVMDHAHVPVVLVPELTSSTATHRADGNRRVNGGELQCVL